MRLCHYHRHPCGPINGGALNIIIVIFPVCQPTSLSGRQLISEEELCCCGSQSPPQLPRQDNIVIDTSSSPTPDKQRNPFGKLPRAYCLRISVPSLRFYSHPLDVSFLTTINQSSSCLLTCFSLNIHIYVYCALSINKRKSV